ncbi:MAG: tripartite tricarboxylate transporter TctB family protein [Proteobacteria bacterium]|nr:tripartite tricarboxylate transporter TctB family protein [Pseudomonadota bacterium]
MRLSSETVLGILAVAVAGGYYAESTQIQQSLLADAVGADGVPRMLAYGMGATGLILAGRSLLRPPVEADDDGPPDAYRRAAGLLAILIVYLVAVPWIGYSASIAALIAAVSWYAGARPGVTMAAAAVGGAALFWFMFTWLLGIPMPSGIF